MKTKDLEIGDWIRIDWIPYDVYVIDNNEISLKVTSPKWFTNDSMTFAHWRFNYRGGKCWKFLGKSKPNPFYNKLTKKLLSIHPVLLVKH